MSEFYVTTTVSKETNTYVVHKDDCSELPVVEELKYLGSYASSEAAFKAATGYFDPVSCCPTCIKEAYPSGVFEYSAEKEEAAV